MNTQQITDWIIDNLNGKRHKPRANPTTGIDAVWKRDKAADGKYYEARIIYFVNRNEVSSFVATEQDLEDSINFSNLQNPATYDQNKLNKLVTEIESKLKNAGKYKLELVSNVSFRVTTLF